MQRQFTLTYSSYLNKEKKEVNLYNLVIALNTGSSV
jgi:hypothetical protein